MEHHVFKTMIMLLDQGIACSPDEINNKTDGVALCVTTVIKRL